MMVENLGWGREAETIVFAHTHQPLADVCSSHGLRPRYRADCLLLLSDIRLNTPTASYVPAGAALPVPELLEEGELWMDLIARMDSRISRVKTTIGALAIALVLIGSLQVAAPDSASARMTQREYCVALIDGKPIWEAYGLMSLWRETYDAQRCGGTWFP